MARKSTGGSLAAVEAIRKRLELSQTAFSEALGFGASSYNDMLRRGEINQTTALAAEALMRRQAPGVNDEVVFVVRIVKGVPLITMVAEARTIVLDDQRFLLVPAELPRRVSAEHSAFLADRAAAAPAERINGAGEAAPV